MYRSKKEQVGNINSEAGFAILGYIVLAALSTFLIVGTLGFVATGYRTSGEIERKAMDHYQRENDEGRASSFLRENSKRLTSPFNRANFYSLFERTNPTYGANDPTNLVPTKLKLVGTNNSVILSNNSLIGTSNFPQTIDVDTNQVFNPSAAFQSAGISPNGLVRITLVDALPADPAKDFGPGQTPETDFYPVYRIDAMSDVNKGSHVIGYVKGALDLIEELKAKGGFIGSEWMKASHPTCYGWDPDTGNLSATCRYMSHERADNLLPTCLFGTLRSEGSLTNVAYLCGNLTCSTPGEECQGNQCDIPVIPEYDEWDVICPTHHAPMYINTTVTLEPGCYEFIDIGPNGKVILDHTIDDTSGGGDNPASCAVVGGDDDDDDDDSSSRRGGRDDDSSSRRGGRDDDSSSRRGGRDDDSSSRRGGRDDDSSSRRGGRDDDSSSRRGGRDDDSSSRRGGRDDDSSSRRGRNGRDDDSSSRRGRNGRDDDSSSRRGRNGRDDDSSSRRGRNGRDDDSSSRRGRNYRERLVRGCRDDDSSSRRDDDSSSNPGQGEQTACSNHCNTRYCFKNLKFRNRNTSIVSVEPSPATGNVELYVKEHIQGTGEINHKEMVNITHRPERFLMVYFDDQDLIFKRGGSLWMRVIAPWAKVYLRQTLKYYGSIWAKQLHVLESTKTYDDQTLGVEAETVLVNVQTDEVHRMQIYK